MEDFVVLCEFCEQEGPVALETVPSQLNTKFDLNSFVLRVLSSDYSKRSDHIFGSDEWTLPQDTQVLLSVPKENAYAYIHHFTLHDLSARGYVRPICIGYVSADRKKLRDHFASILEQMTEITARLKMGSNAVFLDDLEDKIRSMNVNIGDDSLLGKSVLATHGTAASAWEEVQRQLKCLKDRFETLLVNPDQDNDPNDSEDEDDTTDDAFVERPRWRAGESGVGSVLAHSLEASSLTSLSSPQFNQQVSLVLRLLHKRSLFDQKLRTLPELCGDFYDGAMSALRQLRKTFSVPSVILHWEKEEMKTSILDQSTVLTSGDSFLTDFYLGAGVRAPMDHHVRIGTMSSEDDGDTDTLSSISSALEPFESPRSLTPLNSPFSDGDDRADEELLKDLIQSPGMLSYAASDHRESVDRHSPRNLSSFYSGLLRTKRFPGSMITQFARSFPAWGQVAYSLLIGRVVVVFGYSKKKVQDVVRSLSAFVANPLSHSVISWRTKPIGIEHLTRYALIGLQKRPSMIGKSIERYISILDVDYSHIDNSACFIGPVFNSGTFMRRIEFHRGEKEIFPSERTFLCRCHCVMQEIALKSFLYFHLKMVVMSGEGLSLVSEYESGKRSWRLLDKLKIFKRRKRGSSYERKDAILLRRLDILGSDVKIVQHFVNVVKDQLCNLRFAPCIRIDFGTKLSRIRRCSSKTLTSQGRRDEKSKM